MLEEVDEHNYLGQVVISGFYNEEDIRSRTSMSWDGAHLASTLQKQTVRRLFMSVEKKKQWLISALPGYT